MGAPYPIRDHIGFPLCASHREPKEKKCRRTEDRLDRTADKGDNADMSKSKPTDDNRSATGRNRESGLTRYRIAKETPEFPKATFGASFKAAMSVRLDKCRQAGRILRASADAGPASRAADADAGKPGKADTGKAKGETKGETKGELTGSPPGKGKANDDHDELSELRKSDATDACCLETGNECRRFNHRRRGICRRQSCSVYGGNKQP